MVDMSGLIPTLLSLAVGLESDYDVVGWIWFIRIKEVEKTRSPQIVRKWAHSTIE